MRIEFISFQSFPPFVDDIVRFPQHETGQTGEVHLFAGENGCGKTRLLCSLLAACGNSTDLDLREPIGRQDQELHVGFANGNSTCLWTRSRGMLLLFPKSSLSRLRGLEGKLDRVREYDADLAPISSPSELRASTRFPDLTQFVRSEFSVQAYHCSRQLADEKIAAMQAPRLGELFEHIAFSNRSEDDLVVCQSMANLKMGAAMELLSSVPETQSRCSRIIRELEHAITTITGRSFGFKVAAYPDVHLTVQWGNFSCELNILPDGLRALLAWLAGAVAKIEAQYPEHSDPLSIPLLLFLDEPESHLHPAWQRKLLPAIQRLFPHSQIFASTHSPFILSSATHGWIHRMNFGSDGLVRFKEAIPCRSAETEEHVPEIADVEEAESMLESFRRLCGEVEAGVCPIEALEEKACELSQNSKELDGLIARLVASGLASES